MTKKLILKSKILREKLYINKGKLRMDFVRKIYSFLANLKFINQFIIRSLESKKDKIDFF